MAIGAIGNTIYVNQQTASVSSVQGNLNTKFDLQNLAAQIAANEKDEKVNEVRPTEENQMVDADRERQKEEEEQKNKRSPKDENEEDEEEKDPNAKGYKLDIKV
ncbi:MAG: hypothetical protein RBR59_02495 [Sulfurimonadaceae bacterium]|jgi:Ni/Co efflux regulator RcnB|nr:hypothetical protein [Sulfurimonadaceae bacterium]